MVHATDRYDPSELPVPHGYELAPEQRRLLRSRPPAVALEWAAAAYGHGARVLHARSLPGGTSSAIHVLTVDDRRGGRHQAVLRRYVRPDVMHEASDESVLFSFSDRSVQQTLNLFREERHHV